MNTPVAPSPVNTDGNGPTDVDGAAYGTHPALADSDGGGRGGDYQDGTHAPKTAGYIIMECGHHTLINGVKVEPGTFDTTQTSFGTVSFAQPFQAAPVVIPLCPPLTKPAP
jgi:hypothetical protein